MVLSCHPTQFSAEVLDATATVDAAGLLAWSDDPALVLPLYAAAATLVRDLRDRLGAAAFLDHYRRFPPGAPATVDAQFAASFRPQHRRQPRNGPARMSPIGTTHVNPPIIVIIEANATSWFAKNH